MAIELKTVRLKVERAEKHFLDFKAALGIGLQAKYRPRASGIHLQDDGTLKYSTNVPEPGPEDSIILGDALHQLRSSLDHLVCLFAVRNHSRAVCEDFKLSFPIVKSPTDFNALRQVSQGTFERLIGIDAFAELERSQPYQRNPLRPTGDALYILSQLDNIDKHRLVIVFGQTLTTTGSVHQEGIQTPFRVTQKVKAGTQVLDLGVPTIPGKPIAVEMDQFTPEVTFAETDGLCDGERVLPMFSVVCQVNSYPNQREPCFSN